VALVLAAFGALIIALMLGRIDAKFWGVVVMGGAVIILFFLPWLDYSPVKSHSLPPELAQDSVWHLCGELL